MYPHENPPGGRTNRGVFLDLNGTLVMPISPRSLDELMPLPGALEAVRLLTEAGFICPVITVQSRIAKGIYTAAQLSHGSRS